MHKKNLKKTLLYRLKYLSKFKPIVVVILLAYLICKILKYSHEKLKECKIKTL